jgi:hypothetical protein
METTQWQTCGSQVVDDMFLIAESTMEVVWPIARWQTCGSQVVDDKYLMADSTMETTQWQTCGSQVVEDKSLIAGSTMEMVGIWLNWCLLFYERTKLLFPWNMRYHVLKAFAITCWANSLGSEWWLMPYFGVCIPCFRVAPQPSIKFWLAIQARENDHQWPNLVFVFLSFE